MRRLIMTAAGCWPPSVPSSPTGCPAAHQAYPLPPPPQPSQSCLMTALQMGYLTGRRELPTPTPKPASPSPARAVSCCHTTCAPLLPACRVRAAAIFTGTEEWPMSAIALCATILLALVTAASAQRPPSAMPAAGSLARSPPTATAPSRSVMAQAAPAARLLER